MAIASRAKELLGTLIEIKLPEQHSHFFPICFAELERIEATYSRFLNSQLTKANQKLGVWQEASDEFIYLLSKSEEFRQNTNGNFDIALKSVLDEMGYVSYSSNSKKDKIVSSNVMMIDRENNRFMINKEIELGGLGKGFALDRLSSILHSHTVDHYYVNAGGDICAKKGKSELPWTIILEHPDDPSRAIGTICIDGSSIACSSPNRRKWGNNHHLINAPTKKPATGIKAIFVTAKTGIEADAYATGLFTAGFSQAIALSEKLPIEVLIISSDGKMFQSKGFDAELFG